MSGRKARGGVGGGSVSRDSLPILDLVQERALIMPETSFSPDDMNDLAKFMAKPTATAFLNKLSNAANILYEPINIRRMAKAKAEVDKITSESEVAKADLYRRAEYRRQEEDLRHQSNMESISGKAVADLSDDAEPASMNNDWIANFFDRCRNVSDNDMQSLWARVLAGEANAPGSYSKRTVNFLSELEKNDANLFTELCGFGWIIGNVMPLIFDYKNEIYNRNGINFNTLSHLEDIGLIQFNFLGSYYLLNIPKSFSVSYYDRVLTFDMPAEAEHKLQYGKVRLTNVGKELAPICGSLPVNGFWEYVKEQWKQYLPKET